MERFCVWLLYILTTTLVFEGLLRKLLPSVINIALFFFKDFLCLIALFITYDKYSFSWASQIKQKWIWVSIAFIPLLILAFTLDPVLAIFGAKQYLLYAVVAMLLHYCFLKNGIHKLKNFLFYFSSLILPTTAIAILQNSLPSTHWLNLAVSGSSLEAFSAGGYLRVSSTFSFTGQYAWFLNAACPLLITYFSLPSDKIRIANPFRWFYIATLIICFIISVFITGSRTSVLGAGGTLIIGFSCIFFKKPQWALSKGVIVILLSAVIFFMIKSYRPEFFAAYEARSTGTEEISHNEEIESRVLGGLTNWTSWLGKEELPNIMMGNGIGVMSNGVDQLSSYARGIRQTGLWTEDDTSTIFWEGGIYLAIIWYALRLFIILLCFKMFWSFKKTSLIVCSAFLFSYILITGVIGTIGMQPPIAIWWWMAVGVLTAIKFNEPTFK